VRVEIGGTKWLRAHAGSRLLICLLHTEQKKSRSEPASVTVRGRSWRRTASTSSPRGVCYACVGPSRFARGDPGM